MSGKKKIFFIIAIISLVLPLHSNAAHASEIEIKPVLEGEEYYIMKLGQTQTFEAMGVGWDKENKARIPGVEIKALQWAFDSRFLELVEKNSNTITLKAIKERTNRLTAQGEVADKPTVKTIFIVIE